MFRNLRLKLQPQPEIQPPGSISRETLALDATRPITLSRLNELPENVKKRIYRLLLPTSLLSQLSIDPITWKGPDGEEAVHLKAEAGYGAVNVTIRDPFHREEECVLIEIADNAFNGLDLNLLVINDPTCPRFNTDVDETGAPTLFGTLRRNLPEEERALAAGLAPGQVRKSFNASRQVFQQLDAFLSTLGHRAYSLEPLTYASAWVFERRGFAYVRGHKLMDDIHAGFQPGGKLSLALDNSTPFRNPEGWRTVRGRAWAIHDGVLEAIGATWNNLRMIKQVGRHAGVETFPDAIY